MSPEFEMDLLPATRRMVYEKLKPLITDKCPFVNLPETGRARWGEILDEDNCRPSVEEGSYFAK